MNDPIFKCEYGHSYHASQCKVGARSGDLYCPICNSVMPNKRRDFNKMHDEIHSALCANGMNGSVADFLSDLAIRIHRMEDDFYERHKAT